MFFSFQKFFQSRIASLIVIIYSLGSILGYGLHELWDCQHCHPGNATCQYTSTDWQALQDFKFDPDAAEVSAEDEPSNTHPELLAKEEDCAICAFLAQAQTISELNSESGLVENLINQIPVSESIRPLFLPSEHLARGPPIS